MVVNLLPFDEAMQYASALTDSGTGVSTKNYRVLFAHVLNKGARPVSPQLGSQVADSTSIHYSPSSDPVVYSYIDKTFIKPSGGTIVALAYPSITYSDSSLTTLPTRLEPLIVLFATNQAILQVFNTLQNDLDEYTDGTSPTVPSSPTMTYSEADSTVISGITIADFSGYNPDYTKATLSEVGAITIPSPISFTLTPPTTLDTDGIAYSNADTITAEYETLSSILLSDFDFTLSGYPTLGIIPSSTIINDLEAPTLSYELNTLVGMDFTITSDYAAHLNTMTAYVQTEEDIELAMAKMKDIETRLSELKLKTDFIFQQALEDSRAENDINKQNSGQQLMADIEIYRGYVNRFQSELELYRTNVQTVLDTYRSEAQSWAEENKLKLEVALSEYTPTLKAYEYSVQKEIEEARGKLQVALQNAQLATEVGVKNAQETLAGEIASHKTKLERYLAELQYYQAVVQKTVAEFQSNLERYIKDREFRLQTWQTAIQIETNVFQKELAIYQAEVQSALENARIALQVAESNANRDDNIDLANKAKTLEADLSKYQLELQRYQAEMQGYIQEMQLHVANKQILSNRLQMVSALKEQLKREYTELLQIQLGVGNDPQASR